MSLYGSNPFFGGTPSMGPVPFADPYRDMATASMPTSINSALAWGEYLWYAQGTYAMAMKRIASYFITEIELGGKISTDEKDKIFKYLTDELGTLSFIYLALLDRLCYGNSFVSVLVPFQRFLFCPKSRYMVTLREAYENPVFDFKFDSEFNFVATCPLSGWRGAWEVIDKPRDESQKLILKRWNPHEIEILYDPYNDECAYLWRIPENYKRMVREGNLFHLERVNRQVLTAIKSNQLFMFNKEAITHLREPTLAGVRSMGWGLPPALTHHRQLWYLQVLRRQHEAIGMDYIIPFRLITPAARSGGGGAMGGVATQDPMAIFSGQDFKSQVGTMLTRRRRDPAGWHTLPFPVQYQMLGADANNLVPLDMLTSAVDTLLNETGTPVEFYKGTMAMQAAPISLRLFESTHRLLVSDANKLLQWICTTVCRVLLWEPTAANLRRVTIADDVQKQMAVLQLMAGNQISRTSGLRAIGYDNRTERQYLMEEAKLDSELQMRQQEEMEQAGFAAEVAKGVNPLAPPPQQGGAPAQGGGAPAQGGAPPQGGDPSGAQMAAAGGTPVSTYIQSMSPDTPVTPNDLQSAAEMLADELLGLPEIQKNQQLRELKKFNPALHSMVLSKLDERRNQMRMIGGQQMQQQQYGTS